jgi:hypothetical protein
VDVKPAIGWKWIVWYQWDGEEVEAMLLVALTAERAFEEARYSPDLAGVDYSIVGVVRDDKISAL